MLCCHYNCLKEKISTFQEKLLCEFLLALLGWIFCDVKEPGKPFDVNFPQDYITSYQAFCFGPIRRKMFPSVYHLHIFCSIILRWWCCSLYAEWCQSKPWKSFTFTFFPDKCNGELGNGGWEQNIFLQLKTSWTNQHQESEKYRKKKEIKDDVQQMTDKKTRPELRAMKELL